MSYDFMLFPVVKGEDPLVTAHRKSNSEMEDMPGTKPDPAQEALRQATATALVAANPHFEISSFDYERIAEMQQITVEEAKLEYRHVELTSLQDGTGIQIQLFDEEAALSIPFWHEGRKADKAFRDIWQYFDIIHREMGYVVYDRQLDVILDLSQGYGAPLDLYKRTIRVFKRQNPHIILGPPQQKKWWQFWKKR